MPPILIFGLIFSVLVVFILGFLILRAQAHEKAKIRLYEERQRNLKNPASEQSTQSWHDNQHMHMR